MSKSGAARDDVPMVEGLTGGQVGLNRPRRSVPTLPRMPAVPQFKFPQLRELLQQSLFLGVLREATGKTAGKSTWRNGKNARTYGKIGTWLDLVMVAGFRTGSFQMGHSVSGLPDSNALSDGLHTWRAKTCAGEQPWRCQGAM
ncbi:hypothetical protein ACVWZA_001422 [Sphingomonas sp. UYAg733]